MGKVVGIDAGRQRTTGTPPQRRRRRPSKTALVLGGGGFTGAVYEIGALRALDLLAVNRTVNDFDVYVGTSAGAFVASMCANGITPEEMMRVVDRHGPAPFRSFELGTLLRPNYVEYVKKGVALPFKLAGMLRELAPQLRQLSLMDLVVGLGETLPAGVYTGSGIEGYVREVLADPARTDDFRRLGAELYLVATDLDTCERVVFGREGWDDVPISTAVRASTALPVVYAPVEVKGRELVDGGIVSTTNLDLAVRAGAKLIVVVNPLVPFIDDGAADGGRPRPISDMGLPQVGYQAFKLMAYQRLHEQARHWQDRYPGVDIVLIEPDPDDELMFQTSIMNYTKRVQIAKHGFQSVTLKLSSDYERFRAICERHGVEISADRLRAVVKHVSVERERTRAWRRILEQTTGALLRQAGSEA